MNLIKNIILLNRKFLNKEVLFSNLYKKFSAIIDILTDSGVLGCYMRSLLLEFPGL